MRRTPLAVALGLLALPALGFAGGQQQFPTRFAELSFKASASKVVFKGTLASADEKCVKGRKVKLIRKHKGNTDTLASDESDSHGDFKVKVQDPPIEGKFYGLIKQKKLNNGAVCLERETASLTISVD
jgi:hypothetical protein